MILRPVPLVPRAGWRPAPIGPSRHVGQAAPTPVPAVAQPSLFGIDGPLWAVMTDGVVVVSGAMLASGFGAAGSRYSSLFWGITAVAGFKTLLDLSRLYR